MSDLKMKRNMREAATTSARPQMSINQFHGTVHGVRGTEYGAEKYARGNYHGAPPEGVDPAERGAGYIDAALRHLMKVAQAYNEAKGTGGDVRAALAIVDDDSSGGFPPSNLPHISHAIAGLKILVECLVHDGILPADPGQPWKAHPMYQEVLARRAAGRPASSHYGKSDSEIRAEQGVPQKVDPDAERARVESLGKPIIPFNQTPEDAQRDITGRPPVPLDGATTIPPGWIPAMRDIKSDAFEGEHPAWPRGMRM